MAQRVLSPKALNRAVLARQLLLERADVAIPAALERVAGLQTQYAPSGYVGLWSRLAAFERADLTRALEQRTVVQATVMRVTIHMVAAGDYYPFTAGVRRARQAWWLAGARPRQLDRAAIDDLVACVRDALAAGPRRRADLVAVLEAGGFGRELWYAAGLWVDMVRVPPSGTWERRRADLYGLAEDWIDPVPVSEEEGLAHLVTRYLHGFGPASTADIASFTGVNVTTLRPVLEQLGLRRFSSEDGTTLLDMRDGLLPDPDTPAPVRFLPTWDASLLVHARRAGILPEQYRSLVFHTRTPHSVPTFLVDGAVAGTWRYEGGQVRLEPFGELAASSRRATARRWRRKRRVSRRSTPESVRRATTLPQTTPRASGPPSYQRRPPEPEPSTPRRTTFSAVAAAAQGRGLAGQPGGFVDQQRMKIDVTPGGTAMPRWASSRRGSRATSSVSRGPLRVRRVPRTPRGPCDVRRALRTTGGRVRGGRVRRDA